MKSAIEIVGCDYFNVLNAPAFRRSGAGGVNLRKLEFGWILRDFGWFWLILIGFGWIWGDFG